MYSVLVLLLLSMKEKLKADGKITNKVVSKRTKKLTASANTICGSMGTECVQSRLPLEMTPQGS